MAAIFSEMEEKIQGKIRYFWNASSLIDELIFN